MTEIDYLWFQSNYRRCGRRVILIRSSGRRELTSLLKERGVRYEMVKDANLLDHTKALMVIDESGLWDEEELGKPSPQWIVLSGIMTRKLLEDDKTEWNGKNVLRSTQFTGLKFQMLSTESGLASLIESHNGTVLTNPVQPSHFIVVSELPEELVFTERLVSLRHTDGNKVLGKNFINIIGRVESVKNWRQCVAPVLEGLRVWFPNRNERKEEIRQILALGGQLQDHPANGSIILLTKEDLPNLKPAEILKLDDSQHLVLDMCWITDLIKLGLSTSLLDIAEYRLDYVDYIPHPSDYPNLSEYRIYVHPNIENAETVQLTLSANRIPISKHSSTAHIALVGDFVRVGEYRGKHALRWDCVKTILDYGTDRLAHSCDWTHSPIRLSREIVGCLQGTKILSLLDEGKSEFLRRIVEACGGKFRTLPASSDSCSGKTGKCDGEIVICEPSSDLPLPLLHELEYVKLVKPEFCKDYVENGWAELDNYVFSKEEYQALFDKSTHLGVSQQILEHQAHVQQRNPEICMAVKFEMEEPDLGERNRSMRILMHIQEEMTKLGLAVYNAGVIAKVQNGCSDDGIVLPNNWKEACGAIQIASPPFEDDQTVLGGWFSPEEKLALEWWRGAGELVCRVVRKFGMAASHVKDPGDPLNKSIVLISSAPSKETVVFMVFQICRSQEKLLTISFHVPAPAMDCFSARLLPSNVAHPQATIVCGQTCVCNKSNGHHIEVSCGRSAPLRTFTFHDGSRLKEVGCPLVILVGLPKSLFRIRLSSGYDGEIESVDYECLKELLRKCDSMLAEKSFEHEAVCDNCWELQEGNQTNIQKYFRYMLMSEQFAICVRCKKGADVKFVVNKMK